MYICIYTYIYIYIYIYKHQQQGCCVHRRFIYKGDTSTHAGESIITLIPPPRRIYGGDFTETFPCNFRAGLPRNFR